jgi:hypothetical protein
MTHAKLISTAALILVLVAPSGFTNIGAVAQTQPQGQTLTSPPPPSGGGGGKPTRASCTKHGKEQGLKGGKLSAFVKTCMKG